MKTKIKDRLLLDNGAVELTNDSLLESLFSSNALDCCSAKLSEEIAKFNYWANMYDTKLLSTERLDINHKNNQKHWKMPSKYKEIDIEKYVLSLCDTTIQIDRVNEELELYKERNMYDVLRYLIYFVDTLRANNVVWGLGRGSSVASYILFLLNIHRVDSLKYKLNIKEFLKD